MLIPQQSEHGSDASTFALWTDFILSEHRFDRVLVIADQRRSPRANVTGGLIVAQHLPNSVAAYSLSSRSASDRLTGSHAMPNTNPLDWISIHW
jgi:hypothetical protein